MEVNFDTILVEVKTRKQIGDFYDINFTLKPNKGIWWDAPHMNFKYMLVDKRSFIVNNADDLFFDGGQVFETEYDGIKGFYVIKAILKSERMCRKPNLFNIKKQLELEKILDSENMSNIETKMYCDKCGSRFNEIGFCNRCDKEQPFKDSRKVVQKKENLLPSNVKTRCFFCGKEIEKKRWYYEASLKANKKFICNSKDCKSKLTSKNKGN